MHRRFLALMGAAILLVDVLAVHDILGGRESDLFWEYVAIYLSVPVLVFLLVLGLSAGIGRDVVQKGIIAAMAALFLVLDGAALHDILKANESSYRLEYAALLASGVFLAMLAVGVIRRKASQA